MKYEVGDIVEIRDDLIDWKQYGGGTFAPRMGPLKGRKVRITDVTGCDTYKIEGDYKGYNWTKEMFVNDSNSFKTAEMMHALTKDRTKVFIRPSDNLIIVEDTDGCLGTANGARKIHLDDVWEERKEVSFITALASIVYESTDIFCIHKDEIHLFPYSAGEENFYDSKLIMFGKWYILQ